MTAGKWMFPERATKRNITRLEQKNLLSRYKYPFGRYDAIQHEDTLLEGNRKKVEQ